MGFVIRDRIWQLIEKLYIHCYKIDNFINFLETHKIRLPDDIYSDFEIYLFMSTEQNSFTQIMQRVPSYRYISILEQIVFDENIKRTKKDNWNYYGVYIHEWYPELLEKLKQSGFKIDKRNRKIIFQENISERNIDFLICNFNDPLLDYIGKEINEAYNNKNYLAVMLLSRKLIECLIVRVFEVVFRKHDEIGEYNKSNHSLWYDKSKNRINNLDVLLDNLKNNSTNFSEDKDFVEHLCSIIRPLKNEMNKIVHYDYKIPNQDEINKWDIPNLFYKLGKLYRKYCNP